MNISPLFRHYVGSTALSSRGLARLFSTFSLLTALCLAASVFAEDKKDSPNPAGTWKWTITPPNGQPFDASLKLKLDGDKLSGTFIGRGGNESAIQDAKLSGDEISFKVVRERDGQKFVSNYNGKISGDSIKGKIESDFNGQKRERDWDAKREGASAAVNATGTWKWNIERDGNSLELTLKLKQEGEKLIGTSAWNNANEVTIEDGTVKGDEVAFRVVRERDGRKITSKYRGKISGDAITGKVRTDFTGDEQEFDWTPKRTDKK